MGNVIFTFSSGDTADKCPTQIIKLDVSLLILIVFDNIVNNILIYSRLRKLSPKQHFHSDGKQVHLLDNNVLFLQQTDKET